MTTTTTMSFTATQVLSKFVRSCRENGTSYWHLVDDCEQEIIDLVYKCHDDELPNDWRYNTIVNILFEIKNGNEVSGDIGVDVYTSDLIDWLNITRLGLIDELIDDGMIDPSVNCRIEEQVKCAQFYATERMIGILGEYFNSED